jgi:hypothetical protein
MTLPHQSPSTDLSRKTVFLKVRKSFPFERNLNDKGTLGTYLGCYQPASFLPHTFLCIRSKSGSPRAANFSDLAHAIEQNQ